MYEVLKPTLPCDTYTFTGSKLLGNGDLPIWLRLDESDVWNLVADFDHVDD